MPSATYFLFRKAILGEQQVVCSYDGRYRELCPHIIGTNKSGEEAVLAWQFAGESSGPLPQWRCLKLANVRDARARDGRWYAGGSHKSTQQCVNDIDLDINVHVRKLRKWAARMNSCDMGGRRTRISIALIQATGFIAVRRRKPLEAQTAG